MSEHIRPVTFRHVIRCHKCGLVAESRLAGERDNQFRVSDEHAALRASEGWRVFVGRSRVWYCPEHGPSRSSRAWDATPRALAKGRDS